MLSENSYKVINKLLSQNNRPIDIYDFWNDMMLAVAVKEYLIEKGIIIRKELIIGSEFRLTDKFIEWVKKNKQGNINNYIGG